MAIGGANIGTWNEGIPAGSESVGLGENRIQSVKSTLRTGVDAEHFWDSSGGTVGVHRAGSARAFYGTESQVSTSGITSIASYHEGRLMVTSDTSRLFSVGPSGKAMLGAGPLSLSMQTSVAGMLGENQLYYWAMDAGFVLSQASTHKVTFGSVYSGVPIVVVSVGTQVIGSNDPARSWKFDTIDGSGFSGQIVLAENGDAATAGIMWYSIGTRSFRS